MLRKQSIATAYKLYGDAQFLVLTENLADQLAANPLYPNLKPTVADYRLLIAAFNTAMKRMALGLHAATEERDYAREQLEAATQTWSQYAILTTPDRPDQWAEAGFPLTKGETSNRQPSQKGLNLRLTDGPDAQTLRATQDRQPGTEVYLWRVWPKDAIPSLFGYYTLYSREPQIDIPGLSSGVAYCVQGGPWNNTGPVQWSDAATRIAQ